jgi:hypothetical protein
MNPDHTNSTSSTRHPCTSCSKKRVKCDRQAPCSRCLTHGQECRQPDAQRAPRKPRRAADDSVSRRVAHLEKSLLEMKTAVLNSHTKSAAVESSPTPEKRRESSLTGKLIVEDEKSLYLSGSSWANLTDEVLGNLTLWTAYSNEIRRYMI